MIVGLGGVVLDRSLVIPDIPGWDTVLHARTYSTQQGGMVATALATSARLGCKTEFIGAIGDDDAGGFIIRKFIENKVSCHRLRVYEGEPSPCSICLVNQSTGTRTIIHYKGVQFRKSLDMDIDLHGKKILHIDGYWPETALATAKKAKKLGITVTLDPSTTLIESKYREDIFSSVDIFIPGYAFGKRMCQTEDPLEICRKLYRPGMESVILTHGSDGCYIFNGQDFQTVPAFEIDAVDTTGAGDVFHGAFMAGLIWGYDIRTNCLFSNAAAALKCGQVGGQAGIPSKRDVMDFLASRNCPID